MGKQGWGGLGGAGDVYGVGQERKAGSRDGRDPWEAVMTQGPISRCLGPLNPAGGCGRGITDLGLAFTRTLPSLGETGL